MLCHCGGHMKDEKRGEDTFLRCDKCHDMGMICGKCDKYMEKTDDVFSCKCGNKETYWRGQRVYTESEVANINFPYPPEPEPDP
jgi:hypothetical protein